MLFDRWLFHSPPNPTLPPRFPGLSLTTPDRLDRSKPKRRKLLDSGTDWRCVNCGLISWACSFSFISCGFVWFCRKKPAEGRICWTRPTDSRDFWQTPGTWYVLEFPGSWKIWKFDHWNYLYSISSAIFVSTQSISVCLSVCLSNYLSIYLSVCLFVYLSVYLSIYLSIYFLSLYLNGSPFVQVCLSVCLFVYLSIYLSIYLLIFLSLSKWISICVSLSVWLSV